MQKEGPRRRAHRSPAVVAHAHVVCVTGGIMFDIRAIGLLSVRYAGPRGVPLPRCCYRRRALIMMTCRSPGW
eukprot:3220147-Prymnesium_polylepis.1